MSVDAVAWRRSVPKTLLWILGAFAIAAVGAAMAFFEDGIFVRVIGWLGIACALYGGFRMVWQLIQTEPIIEIGAAGLHDRRLSVVPIPWECIDAIWVRTIARSRYLVLSMTPLVQRRYVHSRVDSRIALAMLRVNGGLLIGTVGMDRPFNDLVAAVERWYTPTPKAPAGG